MLFRVERSAEAQVPETARENRQQRQPCQHQRLLVSGNYHRRR